ncbi:MAG: hypothetical protein Q8L39_04670 [Burkholderiales bacterium]|nr:hypothetical protein [Burkholderiales bacterium]
MEERMEERLISMTHGQMQKVAARLVRALNDAQFVDGYMADEVLMAALYVIGAGLKRRGAVVALDAPLRISLPPLAAGYLAEAKRMGQH